MSLKKLNKFDNDATCNEKEYIQKNKRAHERICEQASGIIRLSEFVSNDEKDDTYKAMYILLLLHSFFCTWGYHTGKLEQLHAFTPESGDIKKELIEYLDSLKQADKSNITLKDILNASAYPPYISSKTKQYNKITEDILKALLIYDGSKIRKYNKDDMAINMFIDSFTGQYDLSKLYPVTRVYYDNPFAMTDRLAFLLRKETAVLRSSDSTAECKASYKRICTLIIAKYELAVFMSKGSAARIIDNNNVRTCNSDPYFDNICLNLMLMNIEKKYIDEFNPKRHNGLEYWGVPHPFLPVSAQLDVRTANNVWQPTKQYTWIKKKLTKTYNTYVDSRYNDDWTSAKAAMVYNSLIILRSVISDEAPSDIYDSIRDKYMTIYAIFMHLSNHIDENEYVNASAPHDLWDFINLYTDVIGKECGGCKCRHADEESKYCSCCSGQNTCKIHMLLSAIDYFVYTIFELRHVIYSNKKNNH